MPRKEKYEDLREACITEALAIIETSGIENLSLREVSRRLGVSHQAPYKHFPSRDHILAEIVRRTFEEFAHHLDARPRSAHPEEDLESMGRAYQQYAREHPLQYRLMFETPLPEADEHPEMMESAQHAFSLLRDCIQRMALPTDADLDALFVWSTMHGLASLSRARAVKAIPLSSERLGTAHEHTLFRISAALSSQRDAP